MSREVETGSPDLISDLCEEAVEDGTVMRRRKGSSSDFDLALMPRDRIFPRTLHSWSVHLGSSNWIATISRPDARDPTKLKHAQFSFRFEKEAKKFCKSYSPPKLSNNPYCMMCPSPSHTPAVRHCRNCGVAICNRCTTRWGRRMVPRTYVTLQTLTVCVCSSCDWLSNAFCLALLQGRSQDAVTIHGTGNVNLRTCFADIHREAMFPIHTAVMGGSLEAVKWLVDKEMCPISVSKKPGSKATASVQTSNQRTLLDLAMSGRPKLDILMYLIHKGLSITDVKNPMLAPKTLEALLKSDFPTDRIIPCLNSTDSYDDSVTTLEDFCAICCETPMDCVLTPCGHQVCCSDCGKQLKKCPICKAECSVLKVFRQ